MSDSNCALTLTGRLTENVDPAPGLDLTDAAAVHLDDALGNRQSEAGSAFSLGRGIVRLLELLENLDPVRRPEFGPGCRAPRC